MNRYKQLQQKVFDQNKEIKELKSENNLLGLQKVEFKNLYEAQKKSNLELLSDLETLKNKVNDNIVSL